MLRLITGLMLLLSLSLSYYVDANWGWFSAFIAVNLIQSAFTN
ncbi:YgaP-like transmembrane domain [Pseudoalteromonas holothuriae]|nr:MULTISPECIES: YgaP-like transmembrane domain [unclassified Pseudoalteromonas]